MLAQVRAVLADIGADAVKVGMLADAEVIARGRPRARRAARGHARGRRPRDGRRVRRAAARARGGERADRGDPPARDGAHAEPPRGARARARRGRRGGGCATARARRPRAGARDRRAHRRAPRARERPLPARGTAEIVEIEGERHPDGAAHGSGCTHSSVLAAQLALGRDPLEAARIARAITGEAIARGLRDVGVGAGPVDVIGLAAIRAGEDAPRV